MNSIPIYIIMSLINSFALMFGMTNLLLYPLKIFNKFIIYIYISVCQIFFFLQFGQSITVLIVGGSLLIIIASNRQILSNIFFSLSGYLITVLINYVLILPLSLFGITITDIYANNFWLITFVSVYAFITFIITYFLGT